MNYDEIAGTFYRIHRPYILQCLFEFVQHFTAAREKFDERENFPTYFSLRLRAERAFPALLILQTFSPLSVELPHHRLSALGRMLREKAKKRKIIFSIYFFISYASVSHRGRKVKPTITHSRGAEGFSNRWIVVFYLLCAQEHD